MEENTNKKKKETNTKKSNEGFFYGVRGEYSKITFPNTEVIKSKTISTMTVSAFLAAVIFALDLCFKTLFRVIM